MRIVVPRRYDWENGLTSLDEESRLGLRALCDTWIRRVGVDRALSSITRARLEYEQFGVTK